MAWTTTRPSGSIVGTDIVRTVFLTDLNTDIDQCFENFGLIQGGTVQDFKGVYSSVGDRLDAMEADILNAGTGTAKVQVGTNAERLAFASPSDGLVWVETDTEEIYVYNANTATWRNIYPRLNDAQAALFGQVFGG